MCRYRQFHGETFGQVMVLLTETYSAWQSLLFIFWYRIWHIALMFLPHWKQKVYITTSNSILMCEILTFLFSIYTFRVYNKVYIFISNLFKYKSNQDKGFLRKKGLDHLITLEINRFIYQKLSFSNSLNWFTPILTKNYTFPFKITNKYLIPRFDHYYPLITG